LLAGLLTACITPTPTLTPPFQKVLTIENAGKICFRDYNLSTRELGGTFRPKGCFSSSCTVPQAQQVDVQLDNSQGVLKFVTKFVLLDTSVRTPPKVCTADCDGGGEVPFKFTDVMTGTYTVILGDQKMGNLEVPPIFKEDEGICFGELY
jgi:hypothetical protein